MLHRRRTSMPNKSNDDRAENLGKTRERVGKTERDRERMARKQARRRRRSECGTCLLFQCV
jgi:hypothetical protein